VPAVAPFTVDLAGLVVAFAGDDPRWEAVLAPRYGLFRTRRAPAIEVALTTRGEVHDDATRAALRAETPEVAAEGGALLLRSASIEARLDGAGAPRATLAAPLDRHGVDALVRLLLAARMPDSLLMHGALLVDAGEAFLATGPSGAGKSTLAKLCGERAHCDELTLLRRVAPGRWEAAALPFWHGRPGGGRLRGVRLLRHAAEHTLAPLPAAEAARRVSAEVIWPTFSPARVARSLALLDRLLAEVEIAELAFARAAGVWPVLAGTVRPAGAGVAA